MRESERESEREREGERECVRERKTWDVEYPYFSRF